MFNASERRACAILDVPRSMQRYDAQPRSDEAALCSRLRAIVCQRPRFGYRRLTKLLRREGWCENFKRVHRLCRKEGLKVRQITRSRAEHLNLIRVLFQAGDHRLRAVDRMAIDDQENLGLRLPEQTSQELDHDGGSEPLGEDDEGQLPLVRNRRHHVAAKPFPGAGDDGSAPIQAVAGARLMIAAQSHLIAPVDLATLCFGLRFDLGILFVER